MSKVILEQKLKELGQIERFEIDSAAFGAPTYPRASENARAAIKEMYGQDFLASHKAKKYMIELVKQADVILAMTGAIKKGLSPGNCWTVKEYAGSSGDIPDPFGKDLEGYLGCAYEISDIMDIIVEKLS